MFVCLPRDVCSNLILPRWFKTGCQCGAYILGRYIYIACYTRKGNWHFMVALAQTDAEQVMVARKIPNIRRALGVYK